MILKSPAYAEPLNIILDLFPKIIYLLNITAK
nr:MAG TPA: hypothetical protein [Caudoviricetes sp.]